MFIFCEHTIFVNITQGENVPPPFQLQAQSLPSDCWSLSRMTPIRHLPFFGRRLKFWSGGVAPPAAIFPIIYGNFSG